MMKNKIELFTLNYLQRTYNIQVGGSDNRFFDSNGWGAWTKLNGTSIFSLTDLKPHVGKKKIPGIGTVHLHTGSEIVHCECNE